MAHFTNEDAGKVAADHVVPYLAVLAMAYLHWGRNGVFWFAVGISVTHWAIKRLITSTLDWADAADSDAA